jgi:hypothetical protein
MTTCFTELNSAIITPILQRLGFEVSEDYNYGVRFDQIVYKSSGRTITVAFQEKYGLTRTKCEVAVEDKLIFEKFYQTENEDLASLLQAMGNDIDSGVVPVQS